VPLGFDVVTRFCSQEGDECIHFHDNSTNRRRWFTPHSVSLNGKIDLIHAQALHAKSYLIFKFFINNGVWISGVTISQPSLDKVCLC
jgi:hypothetical protein